MLRSTLRWGTVLLPNQTEESALLLSEFGGSSVSLKENETNAVLLDEEALYLVENNLLEVYDHNSQLLVGNEELWALFCSKLSTFPIKYKVYLYFKNRG